MKQELREEYQQLVTDIRNLRVRVKNLDNILTLDRDRKLYKQLSEEFHEIGRTFNRLSRETGEELDNKLRGEGDKE